MIVIAVAVVCFGLVGGYAVLASTAVAPGTLSKPLSAEAHVLPSSSLDSADGSATASATSSTTATSGVDIEVPKVVGKSVKIAEAVLSGAGFAAQTRVADPPVSGVTPDTVIEQWPAAGALVQPGSPVVITYQPRTGSIAASGAPVVVIDAGHQQTADLELEPIGPGSKTTKPKVAGGATGVATQAPEYRRTLEIAIKLKGALEAKGVKVVMVRTTNDVDIPNSERAKLGNDAKADLVIRVHCDNSTDTAKNGVATLYPSGNSWVTKIEKPSMSAAQAIQAALAKATGAYSLGTYGRADMSGFNYSQRPAVMVLCGFMSNGAEDTKLGQSAYQSKVASGIAAGVIAYLEKR